MEVLIEQETELKYCVHDTVMAWAEGRVSLQQIRDMHNQLGEVNRQIAWGEVRDEVDVEAARFMHQVTKGALARLRTRGKRIGLKQRNV